MKEAEYYLQRGLFVPKDREKLKREGFLIYPALIGTHKDYKNAGLRFVIASDLEADLVKRTKEKPRNWG